MIWHNWNVKSWDLALSGIIIAIRQQYSTQKIITRLLGRRSGQPRMTTGVNTATYVNCVNDIDIDDIGAVWLLFLDKFQIATSEFEGIAI